MRRVKAVNGLRFEDLLFPKPKCTDCGEILTEENWSPSHHKKKIHLCKACIKERSRRYHAKRKLRREKE